MPGCTHRRSRQRASALFDDLVEPEDLDLDVDEGLDATGDLSCADVLTTPARRDVVACLSWHLARGVRVDPATLRCVVAALDDLSPSTCAALWATPALFALVPADAVPEWCHDRGVRTPCPACAAVALVRYLEWLDADRGLPPGAAAADRLERGLRVTWCTALHAAAPLDGPARMLRRPQTSNASWVAGAPALELWAAGHPDPQVATILDRAPGAIDVVEELRTGARSGVVHDLACAVLTITSPRVPTQADLKVALRHAPPEALTAALAGLRMVKALRGLERDVRRSPDWARWASSLHDRVDDIAGPACPPTSAEVASIDADLRAAGLDPDEWWSARHVRLGWQTPAEAIHRTVLHGRVFVVAALAADPTPGDAAEEPWGAAWRVPSDAWW